MSFTRLTRKKCLHQHLHILHQIAGGKKEKKNVLGPAQMDSEISKKSNVGLVDLISF